MKVRLSAGEEHEYNNVAIGLVLEDGTELAVQEEEPGSLVVWVIMRPKKLSDLKALVVKPRSLHSVALGITDR